jgi:hypothetical protein
MTKRTLWSKVGCLVAAGGLVAGCGMETLPEPDTQLMGEVSQAIAHGKRFSTLAESSSVAARAELQVYRHSDNTSYMLRTSDGFNTGYALNRAAATEDVPVQGNFDGDSLYDVATYRPSNGQFAVRRSSTGLQYTFGFGVSGDFPAVGDFDGDGATDHAVWRPSNGLFYALKSSDTTQYLSVALGQSGDIPVIGNYDGDSKDDFAVWRPCTGTWYFVRSSTGVVEQLQYGMAGDVPVPADYDGDGRTDFAVFRPSNGTWYIRYASTGATWSTDYGGLNDYPVPADYDGDGKADVAFWRPSDGRHHLRYSSNGAVGSVVYGGSGDVPVNTNVYCKNAQGLMRPCFSGNANSGECSTRYCVTLAGSAEWCGPVSGIVRYTTSTPGTYTVGLNSNCQNYSGGAACQYDLYRNGVKVTDSDSGRWYNVRVSSYTTGACAPPQPQACGVNADSSYTLP